MKQNATIKTKKRSFSQKSILLNFEVRVDYPRFFTIKCALYVPKADLKKPMPKGALSITTGDDGVKIVSGTACDIADALGELYNFIREHEDEIQAKIEEEQTEWLRLQKEYMESRARKPKIISVNEKKKGE